MRYFTKEWYNDTVIAEMCFAFRKTQKADVYSDKFFEKLYVIEKKAYLKHSKRAAKFEKRKFDPVASGEEFDRNYEENLAFVKANLPEDILCDIKDLRVLALGSVTYEMAARITRFCGQINNRCEATKRKYDEANDEVVDRMGGCIPHLFSELCGAPIAEIVCEGNDSVVTTSHEYTGVAVRIILANACLVDRDEGLEGAMIYKYELLPHGESGIEFSVLAIKEDSSLVTFTFTADSLKIDEI